MKTRRFGIALAPGLLLLLCVLVASPAALASPQKSKSITMAEAPLVTDRGQARRVFVVGFAGQVNIIPLTRGNQITVRAVKYLDKEDSKSEGADALNQLVVRSTNLGNTVEVRAQLPPNGADWTRWAQGKHVPQVRLDISAPENMGLDIYWTHGDVHIPHWKAPITVVSQEGHLSIQDVTGDVTVKSMFGSDKVENIKGSVSIENFSSALLTSNVTGKVKIRNFSGEAHVKKVNGPMIISSQKGPMTIQDTQGSMELKTGIAAIHVLEHKGGLTGHSDSGSINAKLIGQPVDVHLTSVSGPLTLFVPRASQASVSLFTGEGHLSAPSSLDQKRDGSGRSVHGNINGGQGGKIRLHSDSGDLALHF